MDGTKRSVDELSGLTGIPQGKVSGKVLPHLLYMVQMGLLDEDRATLSALGNLVYQEDPACRELITQWILHSNLTSANGADMWHFVYRELLPANGGCISKAFLATKMAERYGEKTRFAVIESCYNKGLADLMYINSSDKSLAVQTQRIQRDMLYVYAYDMLREWDVLYTLETEITAEQLLKLQCAACFGLTDMDWFSVLEMMSMKGLIRLNRQLTPYTVIRLTSTQDAMKRIYSLLI